MERYIRKPEIRKRSGLSDATIWRLERQGKFPARRQIAPGSVAYLESEFTEWLESREKVTLAGSDAEATQNPA